MSPASPTVERRLGVARSVTIGGAMPTDFEGSRFETSFDDGEEA